MWRNWQTRKIQVLVGDHAGSSPVIRTKIYKDLQKYLQILVFLCCFMYNYKTEFKLIR